MLQLAEGVDGEDTAVHLGDGEQLVLVHVLADADGDHSDSGQVQGGGLGAGHVRVVGLTVGQDDGDLQRRVAVGAREQVSGRGQSVVRASRAQCLPDNGRMFNITVNICCVVLNTWLNTSNATG